MSSRNARARTAADMFPGMPDILTGQPPKATEDLVARTLDEAIQRSHDLLDFVMREFNVVGVFGLFSGGEDSIVVNHLMRDRVDAVIHINTGTGIRATTQYVRDVVPTWSRDLAELRPAVSFADLVMGRVIATTGEHAGRRAVWRGFPGPRGHQVMYRRLKDEPLQRFRREQVGKNGRRDKIVFLGGMRWAETARRFRNAEEIDRDGAIVWVSPIVHWTNAHMREYRNRHRCNMSHDHAQHRLCTPDALPLNEVTAVLHMSGECLCGAYAKPGELAEIETWYPQDVAPLRALEAEARAAGIEACTWGVAPPGCERSRGNLGPAGRMCRNCTPDAGQLDVTDQWLADGLIDADTYAMFHREDDADA